jgi:uncharacterized membrane protein (Fun14 family)
MEKMAKKKITMIVFLIIGILGYSFIMLFTKRGVIELSALMLFAFVVNYTSGFLTSKRTEYKLSDLISLYLGAVVTLSMFSYIEPILVIGAKH